MSLAACCFVCKAGISPDVTENLITRVQGAIQQSEANPVLPAQKEGPGFHH
jgi:hypothetical protein